MALEDERDAVPSVDSIKQELDAVKKQINHNKEEIRGCRVCPSMVFFIKAILLILCCFQGKREGNERASQDTDKSCY